MKGRLVFLLALAWGAAGSPPGPAAPFSHSVHLKLQLECTNCHTAAPGSTRVEDNLLPSAEICQSCHNDAQIPAPRKTLVAHFSHAQHLKMGNVAGMLAAAIDRGNYLQPPGDTRRHLNTKNACVACHRGMEESTRVSPSDMPRMADCLVCHVKIEMPFSCETCHAADAKLKPASHVPQFMDSHSRANANLDKTTCTVCHGRDFRCMGCH